MAGIFDFDIEYLIYTTVKSSSFVVYCGQSNRRYCMTGGINKKQKHLTEDVLNPFQVNVHNDRWWWVVVGLL